MNEIFFLIILASLWLVFATIQDLRKREIANWLSFSLIIFAVGFRFLYSLFSGNFSFFYHGLIGLAIFFILANILYYGRFFAGGDFKLMIALGAILPFSDNFSNNLEIFLTFLAFFFIAGAIYTIGASLFLGLANFKKFKKAFSQQFKKAKNFIFLCFFFSTILIVFGFSDIAFFALAGFFLFLPILYIYVKSVDESCLVKLVDAKSLTEGDWLYKDVYIGKQIIKASWDGLSKKDIEKLKHSKKKIMIRHGIPFTPVFLISFFLVIYFWFSGFETLWNSFW